MVSQVIIISEEEWESINDLLNDIDANHGSILNTAYDIENELNKDRITHLLKMVGSDIRELKKILNTDNFSERRSLK